MVLHGIPHMINNKIFPVDLLVYKCSIIIQPQQNLTIVGAVFFKRPDYCLHVNEEVYG
jgi:hypothetical protein